MIFKLYCLFGILLVQYSYASRKLNFEPYTEDELPKLFSMDNYYQCKQTNGKFCKVDVLIKPRNPDSKLTHEIQKSKETRYRFDRSYVHRLLCTPNISHNSCHRQRYAHDVIENELKDFNVSVEITDMKCGPNMTFRKSDILMWSFVGAYILLIFNASYYYFEKERNPKHPKSKLEKWYSIFAIQENWKKLIAEKTTEDSQRLKSVQGIRFFNSVMVVLCHSKVIYGQLFLDNATELEKVLMNPIYNYSVQLDLFIVQTFMMISSFILTIQVYDIYQTYGYFSLYHCWILYVNRIFRFFPSVLFMVLFMVPCLKIISVSPQVMDAIALGYNGCQSAWWAPLLQLNFLFKFADMCMSGSWYISVDTFLYLTAMMILYVKLKFNLDIKKVLGVAFIITAGAFGVNIYINRLKMAFILDAESFKNVFHSDVFNKLYISPLSSWSTCCVGVAIGTIYYYTKNDRSMKFGRIIKILWALIFFGVPTLIVYVANNDLVPIAFRPFFGPLLKPSFSLAIGIGILGMTKNIGGVVRKILEWDFAIKMSNFTFCTYLFHFFLVFARGSLTYNLYHFSVFEMFFYIILDLIASFALGIICTVLIEKPGLTLQKMYIPQIKISKIHENKQS